MANRYTFLEFIKRRSTKYRGQGDLELKCENLLNRKFVLLENISELLAPLGGIPYAIIGGHAVAVHGYPRMTQDIDVLVDDAHLQDSVNALQLQDQHPVTIGGVAGTLPDGTEIDIVSPGEPWVEEAIDSAVETSHGRVVSRPFLILTKLWASRGTIDDTDMLQVLKNMPDEEIDHTRQIVSRYLPNEVEDLESMIMMKDYA